ncbi:MAG TPA: aminopeptidase P family protein [Firmicutes bacterium]|jgi:Xaa-Pro aminopeptidase|nr:aminopeptidase P family protein [Bacillota bacterium]
MMKNRLVALRERLSYAGIDGLLITRPENRRYITGFTGSAGVVVVSRDRAFFVTDFRYVEQATYQAPEFRVIEHGLKIVDTLREIVEEAGITRLGFEKDVITYKQHETFSSALAGVELVPCEGLVETLRAVKDESEIEAIRRAEAIGDAAFSHVLDIIKPGMTEIDVALEIEWFMRKNGAEGIGFEVIVASGERGAMPHGVASSKKLAEGELVVMDFGAVYQGYRGDMTRTVSLGKASPEQRRIYDIVLRAQEAALEAIAPGKTGQEIDGLARKVIEEAGYGDNFGHGLGHGVGLAIHEEPRLSVTATEELRPGMVVTVEPGIYVPGFLGIRIEDLVVVGESGIRNLTSSPKELIEL